MSDLLKEGATASVPQQTSSFSESIVSDQLAPQITTREALALELIRELALRKYRKELVNEVQEMMKKMTHQGLQLFLAISMRYPDYSLLELYDDVISLQVKRESETDEIITDEIITENLDSNL